MRKIFLVLACLILSACTKAQDSASQTLDVAGDRTDATYNKVRDIFDVGKKKPVEEKAQPRYCYKTLEDIICYSRPLPGQEDRLTAYQDAKGHTGYVMEERAAPENTVKKKKPDTASTPPSPTPKTDDMPASKTKNNNDPNQSGLKEIIFDPAELQPKELVPDKPQ